MQRLNGEQHKELDHMDNTKNYAGKIKGLVNELRQVTTQNKDLNE